ncbi:MAG: ADP-ribosylglycohydrolase family protein [Deltaproteobacteria bacterium]|nr:ADP-ribosylglycohydrolase family protein [Deltaproteobacteria bacterium]
MAHDRELLAGVVKRAQGCLLGQLAGDALGSLVEFRTPEDISRDYPNGVRRLADGGIWNTIAGQPTDDSEMALLLARMLADQGRYDPEEARKAYVFWLDSGPFDCGTTVSSGLRGRPNPESQANGAMMRISPLGIFGANHELEQVAEWARQDAALTHPHPVCQQANSLFAMAIAHAIRTGCGARDLYQQIETWAKDMNMKGSLLEAIHGAAAAPPADYVHQQGWVVTAFRNALWQLLHAPDLEQGVVDTVMRGGDTDTNAAICGALLGAVHGRDAIPVQWVESLLNCRPVAGQPHVRRPRPECFWPVDALELAKRLLVFDQQDMDDGV